jgi:hypothetical protein
LEFADVVVVVVATFRLFLWWFCPSEVGWMMEKSIMDEKETNYWPTLLLLLLLWIGLPERLQIWKLGRELWGVG